MSSSRAARAASATLRRVSYFDEQAADLAATINASGAENVIDASPARLDRLVDLRIPIARVHCGLRQVASAPLAELLIDYLAKAGAK